MKTEKINYNGTSLDVDVISSDTFCVHLDRRDIHLQYRQDNEGADHWVDLDTNDETDESMKLGEALEPLLQQA